MFDELIEWAKISPLTIPLAAIVALWILRTQQKAQRLKNSMDFSTEFAKDDTLRESLSILMRLNANRVSVPLEYWADTQQLGSKETQAIQMILNAFERVAAGIEHKIYDEAFLFNAHANTIVKIYIILSPFIKHRRQTNPHFYTALESLVLKWRCREGVSL